MNIFTTFLYQPLFNLLVFFYNLIPDIGLAIILVTIVVKVILWPLTHKSLRSQKILQDLQPKLEALKEKHKDNKEQLSLAMMELYKKEKINPLASCLPLLIQLPIIFAVFKVFRSGLLTDNFDLLYGFVKVPEVINTMMLGLIDLSKPQIFLGVLAGAAQFWHSRSLMKKNKAVQKKDQNPSFQNVFSKQMMYFMPILTVVISASLPGGLALYWLVVTLLTVLDQYLVNRSITKEELGTPQNPEVVEAK